MNRKKIIITVLITLLVIFGAVVLLILLNRPQGGTLIIESDRQKATISIDDKEIGTVELPYTVKLAKGEHTIKALGTVYEKLEKKVTIKTGEEHRLRLDFRTAGEGEEDIKATEKFFEENPLVKILPHNEPRFEIGFYQKGSSDIFYKITLHPIESSADKEAFQKELKTIKENALNWIKNNGVSPEKLNIEWTPPEAANL